MIANNDIVKQFYFGIACNKDGEKVALARAIGSRDEKACVELLLYEEKEHNYFKTKLYEFYEYVNFKLIWIQDYLLVFTTQTIAVFKATDEHFSYRAVNIILDSIQVHNNEVFFNMEGDLWNLSLFQENFILNKISSNIVDYAISGVKLNVLDCENNLSIYENLILINKLSLKYKNHEHLSMYIDGSQLILIRTDSNKVTINTLNSVDNFKIDAINTKSIFVDSEIQNVYMIKRNKYVFFDKKHQQVFILENGVLEKITPDDCYVVEVQYSFLKRKLLVATVANNNKYNRSLIIEIDEKSINVIYHSNRFLRKFCTNFALNKIYTLESQCGNMDWELYSYNINNSIAVDANKHSDMQLIEFSIGCNKTFILRDLKVKSDTVIYFLGPQFLNINLAQNLLFQRVNYSILLHLQKNGFNIVIPDPVALNDLKNCGERIESIVSVVYNFKKIVNGRIFFMAGSLGALLLLAVLRYILDDIDKIILLNPVVNSSLVPNKFKSFYEGLELDCKFIKEQYKGEILIYQSANDEVIDTLEVSDLISSMSNCKSKYYMTAWDEGHVFSKKTTWYDYVDNVTAFIMDEI